MKTPNGHDKKASHDGAAASSSNPGILASVSATMASAVRSGLEKISDAVSTDDSRDAIDLLKAQHRYVEKLFGRIDQQQGSAKGASFRELADILAIHATIEERIFYPAVKSPSTRDLLLESAEEHLGMKRVLADMLQLDPDSDRFDAALEVLEEQVSHHARKEEEAKLFPLVHAEQDPDVLEGLAGEMISLMVDLQEEGSPRQAIPHETEHAAPI